MKTLNYIVLVLSLLFLAIVSLEISGLIVLLGHNLPTAALICGLSIPLALLFLNYVQLRNLKIYVLWLVVGVIMLCIYVNFKDLEILRMKRGKCYKKL